MRICLYVTELVVNGSYGFSSLRTLRKEITEADWKLCLTEASSHPSTSLAATIATHTTWPKLWDMALDHGPRGTVSLQTIYHTLTRPTFGKTPCPGLRGQFASPWSSWRQNPHRAIDRARPVKASLYSCGSGTDQFRSPLARASRLYCRS